MRDREKIRNEIAEILASWNMPTRQVVIIELTDLVERILDDEKNSPQDYQKDEDEDGNN